MVSEEASRDVRLVREVSLTATFTALVFLSTSLFYIGVVASTGFFNLGESFVYLAALIGGPVVGAIAGGVGSALADLALGYGTFAPATLVLKGSEGFVAGYLFRMSKKVSNRTQFALLGLVSVFLTAFAVWVTTPALNGSPQSGSFDFGLNLLGLFNDLSLSIPGFVLVLVVLLFLAILWFVSFYYKEKGKMVLSCALAGPIIVVGYFAYEVFFLGLAVEAALWEVPFNVAQVVFGIVIAVPIVSYLRDLGVVRGEQQTQTFEAVH